MSTSDVPERRLTTTSYALLGLLHLRPWTTYELAKQVDRALRWFWPRTERKLYDEPKRLVEAGYATATEERTGKRPRTVYTITPAGRKALRRWLGEESAPPAQELEAMVRVFFADAGTLAQLRSTLAGVEAAATAKLAELEAMIEADVDPPFPDRLAVNALALRYHLDHERLQAEWARWALEQIESWRSPTDPGGWDHRAALART